MTREPSQWASSRPAPETYKAPPNRSRREAVAEQDQAAGGREHRRVRLDDGTFATASVELKSVGGRRVYSYLRYSVNGHTRCDYLGEAIGNTRLQRLKHAWRQAKAASAEPG